MFSSKKHCSLLTDSVTGDCRQSGVRNYRINPNVRCIIIPATQEIYRQALREGLIDIFIEAECVVSTPTCGPCLGGHMGILDTLFGKGSVGTEELNIEECLEEEEGDAVNPPADFYVKKIDLRNEGDAELAIKEVGQKNIIILNMTPLAKQSKRLKRILLKLKQYAEKVNGDIALITKTHVMITPAKVKIVKAKK